MMRDRLWTLMVRRHADLRKIGYYFHGDAFEEMTPKLQSRVARSTAQAEEEEAEAEEIEEEDEEIEEEVVVEDDGEAEQPTAPASS
ncbi:hypothetical protein WMF31_15130 [Sorangium sp. So ce1036]|uniref:hypothetical protein n=1 Tax=Sorangium sp. So ce1036 TaxID=3133328 RepID=UPI003F09FC64